MAYMEIRLYNYHDDDLLQIRLNGLDLGFIFTRALRACFLQEEIRFTFPKPLTLNKTRKKNSRVKIWLDDRTQSELCTWLEGFEPYYRNQAIKNIARMYLYAGGISPFNAFYRSGKWTPASPEHVKEIEVPLLQRTKKKEDPDEWLDRISTGKTRHGLTRAAKEKAVEEIREAPLQELLTPQRPKWEKRQDEDMTAEDLFPQEPAIRKKDAPDGREYGIIQEEPATPEELDGSVLKKEKLKTIPDTRENMRAQEPVLQEKPENTPAPAATTQEPDDNLTNDEDADDDYDVYQMFQSIKNN